MRRSKAPLVLMEQLVMLAVFALTAALCLQAFVKADTLSRRHAAQDRAAVKAQSAAEVVQACGGDMERAAKRLGAIQFDVDFLMIDYDADWALAQDHMRYTLGVNRQESGLPGLGRGRVWIRDEVTGDTVAALDFSWQEEVDGDGA